MKKLVIAFLFILSSAFLYGQTPEGEELRELPDGGIEVYGIDKFGAKVIVRYDNKGNRVYQERSTADELSYAFFDRGVVIRHGVQDLKNDLSLQQKKSLSK